MDFDLHKRILFSSLANQRDGGNPFEDSSTIFSCVRCSEVGKENLFLQQQSSPQPERSLTLSLLWQTERNFSTKN